MNIAITGGGTGGHLSIAKALALECKKQNIFHVFIGSKLGQDRFYFENNDIFNKAYFLDTTQVVNQKGLNKFRALFKNLGEVKKASIILKSHKIDAVISVGGFSASAASFSSIINWIPLFIHEQNASMGSLNKLLSFKCRVLFSSFEFKNAIFTNYPVSDIFFECARVRKELKTMLFMGGSQGARAINNLALRMASSLVQKNIKIIHQSGRAEFQKVRDEYERMGFRVSTHLDNLHSCNIFLCDFTQNIATLMSKSDFCISRAGAGSLFELSAATLPALFIPYPFAANNHQYLNAKPLADKSLCKIISQSEIESIDASGLLQDILNLDLQYISKSLANFAKRDGQKEIIEHIKKLHCS